jgi:cold shock CspA family protein
MAEEARKLPTETANEAPYRIQSAMVLFALEEALGSFVVQAVPQAESLPAAMLSEIEKRIQGNGFVPVAQIVQETYIKEVIDLAVSASQERSENEALGKLRRLVEALDVFEIRNAVCHPNRQFPECYWHRMAALATDPCIDQLRLLRVNDAFRCAVEGRLTPPPEGWLQQRSWNVPNNLPSTFDHQVTGLIARQEEARDFRKRLQNMRNSLVAIVGPGGTGKTALCLEVLRECMLDPGTLQWADQVIYVSAKTERLTARGVEPIVDPLTSLESVKKAVVRALYGSDDIAGTDDDRETFETIVAEMANRRLLLCIDNLETLIRDHPQDFEDFVQLLPRDWRVLVTSRVSVNGANVLALGPIRREGAMKLTRDYTSLRGASRLDESQIGRLVEVCDRNPLAIRLAIDSYAAGSELAKALEQTKDRITDFSYTSLVDHLPSDATKVLECLFGSNNSLSRGQIGLLLDLAPDQVAEAVNSLLRTSLVTREIDGTSERYALSSSVRDLLLRTPRDARVREEVYSRLREQQRIIADLDRSGTKDPLNESFVPVSAPNHVRALVARVRQSVIGRSSRVDQIRDLATVRRALEFDTDHAVLHRTEALLLEQLSDRYGAIESFGKAFFCEEPDACSQLRLAEMLRDEQRLDEAIQHTKPLVDAGYLSSVDVSQRNKARLLRAHWVSALWLRHYEELLDATKEWRQSTELRPSYVALRVSTLQRMLDDGVCDLSKQGEAISDMFGCLSEGFRLDGYLPDVVHEGFRALDRLYRMATYGLLTSASQTQCALFLDAHLPAMCGTSNEYSLSDEFIVNLVKRFRTIPSVEKNPLQAERWTDLVMLGEPEDKVLLNVGYENSRITNIFPDKGHSFARALDGTRDFFVHWSATELTKSEFAKLRQGQLLLVLPSEDPPSEGRAWPAKHAMLS